MNAFRRTCAEYTKRFLVNLGLRPESGVSYVDPWSSGLAERPRDGYTLDAADSLEEQERNGLVKLVRLPDGSTGVLRTAKSFMEQEAWRRQIGWPEDDGFDRNLPVDHPNNRGIANKLAVTHQKEVNKLWQSNDTRPRRSGPVRSPVPT